MSPYECAGCSEGFTSLSAFDTHLDTDWDDPRGTTVCLAPGDVGLVWQAKVAAPVTEGGRPGGWRVPASQPSSTGDAA